MTTYQIEDEQTTPTHQRYSIEYVAQFVESINDEISRHPERHRELTQADRDIWAGFPAQIRAHRYSHVFLDPHCPILDYLDSGHIGPSSLAKF